MINLFSGNNTIEVLLEGLKNGTTNEYINDATVTVVIYESDGATEVTGQSWPVTMGYVTSSNGNYRGIVSADSNIVTGGKYVIKVNAIDTNYNEGEWIENAYAHLRKIT